jgi:hypothetical protein
MELYRTDGFEKGRAVCGVEEAAMPVANTMAESLFSTSGWLFGKRRTRLAQLQGLQINNRGQVASYAGSQLPTRIVLPQLCAPIAGVE